MLKIGITRTGNAVAGCVLSQTSPLGTGSLAEMEENKHITELRSVYKPELLGNALFVRGRSSIDDNRFFARCYADEKTAQEVVEDIKRLVAKANLLMRERENNYPFPGLEVVE